MNGKRALILGSFDILHYGHLRVLRQAASLGALTVGLGSDAYQASYKRLCISSYEERAAGLAELPYVDTVACRETADITPLLDAVQPDYLVTGSDWFDRDYLPLSGIDIRYLEEQGVALVFMPREHAMSTSELIRRVGESLA